MDDSVTHSGEGDSIYLVGLVGVDMVVSMVCSGKGFTCWEIMKDNCRGGGADC